MWTLNPNDSTMGMPGRRDYLDMACLKLNQMGTMMLDGPKIQRTTLFVSGLVKQKPDAQIGAWGKIVSPPGYLTFAPEGSIYEGLVESISSSIAEVNAGSMRLFVVVALFEVVHLGDSSLVLAACFLDRVDGQPAFRQISAIAAKAAKDRGFQFESPDE